MMPRFVTLHPAFGLGIFLTKPGIDANNSVNPADFLLHSSYKNEQVIKAGSASLSAFASLAIPFEEALPGIPIVVYSVDAGGPNVVYYPWEPYLASTVSLGSTSLSNKNFRVDARVATTEFTLISRTPILTYIQYLVMARSID